MKRLVMLALCAAALPAHAACPAPERWARDFHKTHADFHWNDQRHDPALYTADFDAALKREWAYAKGEVGRLDYDPWLGAQDGDVAEPIVFDAESVTDNTAVVSMRYAYVLDPATPPTKQAAHLVLKKEGAQCWRLDDFITPVGDSLMRLLAGDPNLPDTPTANPKPGAR